MKKLATMALMAACTVAVLARPAFLGVFDKTYPQKSDRSHVVL